MRAEAVAGLRELAEILPSTGGLAAHADSPDPLVRAAVVDLLRALRSGSAELFGKAAVDADHRVRIQAVQALVSLDEWTAITTAAHDDNREVRIAAARGLATIGQGGADTVRDLLADRDPLVRAAALTALSRLGDDADLPVLTAALKDSAWQIREGAARGFASAAPGGAAPALTTALADIHPDIRKAAVLTLSTWPESDAARTALETALADTDADVRAYARRALAVHAGA